MRPVDFRGIWQLKTKIKDWTTVNTEIVVTDIVCGMRYFINMAI